MSDFYMGTGDLNSGLQADRCGSWGMRCWSCGMPSQEAGMGRMLMLSSLVFYSAQGIALPAVRVGFPISHSLDNPLHST